MNEYSPLEILEDYKYSMAYGCREILREMNKQNYGKAKEMIERLIFDYGKEDDVGYRG
jgi:hypothetical protein